MMETTKKIDKIKITGGIIEKKKSKERVKCNSRANVEKHMKQYNARQNQIKAAIEYCLINNCKGKAALATGRFPLIKDHKTIGRRLSGDVIHGEEHKSRAILTPQEEELLVEYMKDQCQQTQLILTRKEMNAVIINMLQTRKEKLAAGHNGIPLSRNARLALANGKLGRHFWYRFDAKYPHVRKPNLDITDVTIGGVSGDVAYVNSLAEEMIRLNILTDSQKLTPGEWSGLIDTSRVFNCVETPLIIDNDATAGDYLSYCPQGEKQNREYVSIVPFIGLSGTLPLCQVVFPPQDTPIVLLEQFPDLLLSSTANGYQNSASFQQALARFDEYLETNGVMRPVLLLTDNHHSRFDEQTLCYVSEKQIFLYSPPPDSKSVTQPLNLINTPLYETYTKQVSNLFNGSTINRETFINLLGHIWPTWTTSEGIVNGFYSVGITNTGLSVKWMQQQQGASNQSMQQQQFSVPGSCHGELLRSANIKDELIQNNVDLSINPSELVVEKEETIEYYKEELRKAQKKIKRLKAKIATISAIARNDSDSE